MTTPFVIDAVASARAVVPRPTGFCMVTVGALSYPLPPVEIATDDIVPAADTIAVAAAANLSTLLTITISFWNSVDTLFSFLALKNGLTQVTYAIVVPIPTV